VAVSKTAAGFEITSDLTNVSDRAGTEVVQVYVDKDAAPVETPDRELAGFAAVSLGAGESTTVTIRIDADDFEYYDEDAGWTVADGANTVYVGRSSRDITDRFTVDI
jgi:beta-glucosidase